jgi:pimeloyl-ACP methyl ester carboxylesterase
MFGRICFRVSGRECAKVTNWATSKSKHVGDWTREMHDGYEEMNFTPRSLSKITASTLIIYGERDPLYPIERALTTYRAIPRSVLWVVPNGGHGPVYSNGRAQFARTVLAFFRTPSLAGNS